MCQNSSWGLVHAYRLASIGLVGNLFRVHTLIERITAYRLASIGLVGNVQINSNLLSPSVAYRLASIGLVGNVTVTAPVFASADDCLGCDLNLIKLKGDRKTILVELIPELTPTSRR